MPLLFYSYIATEMLAPFFAACIIMNGVFFLVKLIPFLNIVLELSIGFGDFIRVFSYLFPNMFLYSIPMASMLGITIGFSRLSNDTEILAFKASGIGIYHALPPLMLVALFISLLTGYFSIKLLPAGDISMQQMMYQLAKEKIDKGIKERVFTEALGDLVVHVNSIDKNTGEWSNVWVSDMRDRENPAITMASSGKMDTKLDQMLVTIILKNGSLHIPDQGNTQTVIFDTYVINIPLQPPGKAPNYKSRRTMTMSELQQSAAANKGNALARDHLTEFHKRLVLPVGCFILSLLGMPLGLQAGPGKKAIGIPIGLALYIFYYICFTTARNISTSGSPVHVPTVMWIPNLLFAILAVIMIKRVANEKNLVPSFIHVAFNHFGTVLSLIYKRIFSFLNHFSNSYDTKEDKDKTSEIVSVKKTKLRGNIKSRVFHFPECDHYYCKNCSIEFKNVDIALQAGFEPCRFCRNLLENNSDSTQEDSDTFN